MVNRISRIVLPFRSRSDSEVEIYFNQKTFIATQRNELYGSMDFLGKTGNMRGGGWGNVDRGELDSHYAMQGRQGRQGPLDWWFRGSGFRS